MVSAAAIARLEKLVWVLIYGGLFGVVLGFATVQESPALGWTLKVLGAVVALAGVVLIWVRSRVQEEQP